MALGSGLLQLLGGGTGTREGCLFDAKSSTVDLTAVCHEARSIDVAEGDKVFVSLKDMRRQTSEQVSPLGAACHLRAVDLDTTLLLRVWAARDELAARSGVEGAKGRRNCGELRIPLHRLVLQCQSMLYQTWATLDCPGLCDSVASIGLGDESGAFDQKLVDGPRQLFQPRVCLSICKTADLGPTGKLLLSADASAEARAAQWGPLLRSQQQHAIMSAALHLQGSQAADTLMSTQERSRAAARIQDLRGRVRAQAEDIEELRRQLREAEDRLASTRDVREHLPGSLGGRRPLGSSDRLGTTELKHGPGLRTEPLERTLAIEAEAEQLQSKNEKQQVQIESLRSEVEHVRQEANTKIDAANERIRALRRDRDESLREGERLDAEVREIAGQKEELINENRQLSDQKEALLRIVEDLHQTCNGAGLQASRRSVDSITANFKLT